MNISLPDTLKSFVDEQVNQGGYSTNSEYVGALIRKDQNRLHLRGLLLAGAACAPAAPADPAYFEGLRDRVRKAVKTGSEDAKAVSEHPEADVRHIVRGLVRKGLKPMPFKAPNSLSKK